MFHYIHTLIMFKHVNFGKHIWIHKPKIKKNMLILKFHLWISVYISFFLFFHPEMKFHCCLFERVFTREISSRDKIRRGMKSSLSMVKCLLLFTPFCRDEISSQDELIPVKKTGMKFHPGMKKRKQDV